MNRSTIKLTGPIVAVHVAGREPVGAPGAGQGDAPALSAMQADVQQQLHVRAMRLDAAIEALGAAADEFRRTQEQLIDEQEQHVVALALEVARKVLMQEVQAGRYEIEPIIKEALLHVSVRKDVVVHLNPEDYTVCEMAQQQAGGARNTGDLHFVADPMVARAACVLETSQGVVDSSVEGHLDEIAKALKGNE